MAFLVLLTASTTGLRREKTIWLTLAWTTLLGAWLAAWVWLSPDSGVVVDASGRAAAGLEEVVSAASFTDEAGTTIVCLRCTGRSATCCVATMSLTAELFDSIGFLAERKRVALEATSTATEAAAKHDRVCFMGMCPFGNLATSLNPLRRPMALRPRLTTGLPLSRMFDGHKIHWPSFVANQYIACKIRHAGLFLQKKMRPDPTVYTVLLER